MPRMELLGGAIVNGAAGTLANQSGCVDSIAHPAAGTWNITLDGDSEIDAAEAVIDVQLIGALAGSDAVSFGVVHTSDAVKQITAVQEQAAGAASVLADVNFAFTIHRIMP